MSRLLSRSLFFNNLRQFHKDIVTNHNAQSTFNINDEKEEFEAVLPEIVHSVVTGPNLNNLPELSSRVNKLLGYTLRGGKLYRGLGISLGYRMLEDPENYSEETQHLARILGWCLEMAFLIVADDMIDGATTRRGRPCWYRMPNVGLSAINDSLLIYQSMMEVLKINFSKAPFHVDMITLVNEALHKVSLGETLDCAWDYEKEKNNLDVLTLDNVKTIAIYKTYYTFRLPTLLVLLLVKNGKEKDSKVLNDICLDLGRYAQCKDDYIDAYGKELITGKAGRDIQEGKCNWVAAAALKHCNEVQRATFAEFYGSENPEHIKRIKQLYDELNIPQLYEQSQRSLHGHLARRINALPTDRQKNFYLGVLNICTDM